MTARPHIALASDRRKARERLFVELEEDGFGVSCAANAMDLALIVDRHARGERRLDAAVVVPERGDGTLSIAEIRALELAAREVPLVLIVPEGVLDEGALEGLGVVACVDPGREDARAELHAVLRGCVDRGG